MNYNKQKRICVILGHYGCGKTNLAINLSVESAEHSNKTSIVDLDIVNPYFRTADFKNMFEKHGISMTSSIFAVSNLDIPAISFDLNAIAAEGGHVIIDVGGDDAGAVALGQYRNIFDQYKSETEILYVINKYRTMTDSPEKAAEILRDIEKISRLKATAIVNNSNLGLETDSHIIIDSLDYAQKVAKLCGLELKYTAYPQWINREELPGDMNFLPVKRYVKAPWEDDAPNFNRK